MKRNGSIRVSLLTITGLVLVVIAGATVLRLTRPSDSPNSQTRTGSPRLAKGQPEWNGRFARSDASRETSPIRFELVTAQSGIDFQ